MTKFQLLKFNHDSLLHKENALLTFELLGYQKQLSHFPMSPSNDESSTESWQVVVIDEG